MDSSRNVSKPKLALAQKNNISRKTLARAIEKQLELSESVLQLNAVLAELASTKPSRKKAVDAEKAALEREISHLRHLLAEKERQLAEVYSSTSWKVSMPVRIVGHQVLRVRRISASALAVSKHAGLVPTIRKVFKLLLTEGPSGLRRGFRAASNVARLISENSSTHDKNNYALWVQRYDTLTNAERSKMHHEVLEMEQPPLISILMPTYNTKPDWLIDAIESVRSQIYPHWELCIADDASTSDETLNVLRQYSKIDKRIKVIFRTENGHISEASNSALEIASGSWVALLDHDDTLAEHALFWVARAISANPSVKLLYSDEDKIDDSGSRHSPYFKCDWNPDLFYSQNMICHLGVYSTELVRKIGGFRKGFEGSQDHDLALRCIEQINDDEIHHIPRVLYHWREHLQSTAKNIEAKPYAVLAGEKALNDHFKRRNIAATAEYDVCGYRVTYDLPKKKPLVSLIIPTRNGLSLVKQCIGSILKKTTYENYEIIVVDNGSDDPETLKYFKRIAADSRVRVLRDDRPFNYSALNNAAVEVARGELIGLINNDIEVISPDWLSELVSHAARPEVGAVGARLWYPNDTLQHGGVIIGLGGVAGHSHKHLPKGLFGYFFRAAVVQSLSAVTAACLVVKKSIYQEVNGLNEKDLTVAFNDVDFCLRIREAGYRNIWTPFAELYHHESATRGFEDNPEKQARFSKEIEFMKKRWNVILQHDPAYSPNLTLDYEDFSLAWPPRVGSVLDSASDSYT